MKKWSIGVAVLLSATLVSAGCYAEGGTELAVAGESWLSILRSHPVELASMAVMIGALLVTIKIRNPAIYFAPAYLQGVLPLLKLILVGPHWLETSTTSGLVMTLGLTVAIELMVVMFALTLHRLYKARQTVSASQ
ncbi:hypothetical protein [Cobetia crustatorum]|uniref:Uncharacterized protein n=1 Tax=Cobetia crustatorum TaxID=553385 RepID=A0A558HKL2_9GAMM|nr:hypothetical protein [Cobetia crustatorum]TVU69598.1 hypothetical protein FQP86_10800 [Cobetia crustatorum]